MPVTSSQCQLEQNKADYMQYLYNLYKRDEAEPGLRGTFTGLYQQHCEEISKEAVDNQVKHWHQAAELVSTYVA